MLENQVSRTSITLLSRLRQNAKDHAAWNEFVARYEPKILAWCRGWGLQDSDAHDVTQDVLLKLHGVLAKFVYDPSRSFRGWLRTVTFHAWRDLVEDRRRKVAGSGDTAIQGILENVAAGESLVRQLEAEFECELLDRAMAVVQTRVAPRTWDAFRLTALEGCTGAIVADRLEMKITRVYTAKSEVKRMILAEIRNLEQIG